MNIWGQSGKRIERRRAPRLSPERLLVHYWTGGLSTAHPVLQISAAGALIASAHAYYPGTLMRLCLENAAGGASLDNAVRVPAVWAVIVRRVAGGFCVEFLFQSSAERAEFRRFLESLDAKEA